MLLECGSLLPLFAFELARTPCRKQASGEGKRQQAAALQSAGAAMAGQQARYCFGVMGIAGWLGRSVGVALTMRTFDLNCL